MTKASGRVASAPVPTTRARVGGWLSGPLRPDTIKQIAAGAHVPLKDNPNYVGACDALNEGLLSYRGELQPVSAPNEFETWFARIALRANELLAEFGSAKERRIVRDNFLQWPAAWRETSFDPHNIGELIDSIRTLQTVAEKQAVYAATKKKTGRRLGKSKRHIGSGLAIAWTALTGRKSGGVTTPSEAHQDRTPAGPFIDFASATLLEAADAFARSRHVSDVSLATNLREAARSPHTLAEIRRAGPTP